jgi:PPOX class probable F420-dependent enzyme
VCYVYDGSHIFSAIDLKPKRVGAQLLKRLRNVSVNPRVALLVDDYSEDWSQLAYVLIQGVAIILQDGEQRARAESMLRDKYPQYTRLLEAGSAVLRITPEKVVSWGRV